MTKHNSHCSRGNKTKYMTGRISERNTRNGVNRAHEKLSCWRSVWG